MGYSKRMKTTACIVVTAAMLFAVDFNIADAISLGTEKGIAGISLSLDKYTAGREQSVLEKVKETSMVTVSMPEAAQSVTEQAIEPEQEVKLSDYNNIGISIAEDYVNIRKQPDEQSEVRGKLYQGSAATILETKGDWVKIKSGNVKGYIKSEFLACGFDAADLIDKYAVKLATVTTQTLKVRDQKSVDSICLTMIPAGETYEVIKEYDDWVKIKIDDDEEDCIKGYVSKQFVDISVEFKEAISIEEEKQKAEKAEAARKAEEEQMRHLQNQQQQTRSSASTVNRSTNQNSSSVSIASSGGSGSQIASYALKFVGNPYVYGGTSLTNGTDCSGFTQAVYRSFGISIPRDSRSQSVGAGREVALNSLQAGDLVFYTGGSGTVNHVALYIGGGKVVHASNPRTGIKVSPMNYRTPHKARRVVN